MVQVLRDACGSDHVEIVRSAVIALTRVAHGGDTAVINELLNVMEEGHGDVQQLALR